MPRLALSFEFLIIILPTEVLSLKISVFALRLYICFHLCRYQNQNKIF